MPPTGDIRKTGIWLAKPTVPSSNADPVSRYTSHDCATVCIHVPINEISCPAKKSWKLRCLNARATLANLSGGISVGCSQVRVCNSIQLGGYSLALGQ